MNGESLLSFRWREMFYAATRSLRNVWELYISSIASNLSFFFPTLNGSYCGILVFVVSMALPLAFPLPPPLLSDLPKQAHVSF